MKDQIESLQQEILASITNASSLTDLEEARLLYLSRNGKLSTLLIGFKELPPEDKPRMGPLVNKLKQQAQEAFSSKKEEFEQARESQNIDPTLPGRTRSSGSLHPISQVRTRIIHLFRRMGFALATGPEIETEWNNFDALNTPPDHPARNEQDTFYLKEEDLKPLEDPTQGRRLLRTHTSPVQIRTMLSQKPPIRIIAPGRCYRRDEIDATHAMSFTQCEGLSIDKNVSLSHMKGTLEYFFRALLGQDLQFRFRPHFFPFTEPSFEVDISRPGQSIHGRQWLEIAGCGMVDPHVLKQVDIDPHTYSGWAFGFGIERMAMMLYGIPDLRLFAENDVRFLNQFSLSSLAK